MMVISSTMDVAVAIGVAIVVAVGVVVAVITGVVVTVPLMVEVVVAVGVDWFASEGRARVITIATKTLTATLPAAAIQIIILIRILVLIIRASLWLGLDELFTYTYGPVRKVLHQIEADCIFKGGSLGLPKPKMQYFRNLHYN
jgi:hypothetical protein